LDIQNQSTYGIMYMMEAFKRLEETSTYNEDDYINWLNTTDNIFEPNVNSIVINEKEYRDDKPPEDAFGAELEVTIGYLYIKTQIVDKILGKRIKYSSESKVNTTYIDDGGDGTEIDTSTIKFYKQINKTQCEEVTVAGLEHYANVYQGKVVLKNIATSLETLGSESFKDAAVKDFNEDVRVYNTNHFTETIVTEGSDGLLVLTGSGANAATHDKWYADRLLELQDDFDYADEHADDRADLALFIPINRDTVNSFTGIQRSQILLEALYMYTYSSEVTYLKWYQQSWFTSLITIVGYILAIISLLYDSSGNIATSILTIVENLARLYLIQTIVKILASKLGSNAILAVLLVAAAAYAADGAGLADLATLLPDAITLLDVVLSVGALYGAAVNQDIQTIQDESDRIAEEQEVLTLQHKRRMEELENTGNPELYAEEAARRTEKLIQESPDSFYNRTIHTPNIGVVSLDMIGNYVETSLMLPKQERI